MINSQKIETALVFKSQQSQKDIFYLAAWDRKQNISKYSDWSNIKMVLHSFLRHSFLSQIITIPGL